MEIVSASLCDFAADYQGKLCILGAFDTIGSGQFPGVHPQCSVAVRLLLRDDDVGAHRIQILFINPDGAPIIPANLSPNIEFHVQRLPTEVFFLSQNFVFNFQGLPLPAPGQYELRILLDGRVARVLPVQFVQVRQPQRPPSEML